MQENVAEAAKISSRGGRGRMLMKETQSLMDVTNITNKENKVEESIVQNKPPTYSSLIRRGKQPMQKVKPKTKKSHSRNSTKENAALGAS